MDPVSSVRSFQGYPTKPCSPPHPPPLHPTPSHCAPGKNAFSPRPPWDRGLAGDCGPRCQVPRRPALQSTSLNNDPKNLPPHPLYPHLHSIYWTAIIKECSHTKPLLLVLCTGQKYGKKGGKRKHLSTSTRTWPLCEGRRREEKSCKKKGKIWRLLSDMCSPGYWCAWSKGFWGHNGPRMLAFEPLSAHSPPPHPPPSYSRQPHSQTSTSKFVPLSKQTHFH